MIHTRYFRLACLGVVFFVLTAIAYFQPYWGLMDDASAVLNILPILQSQDLWSVTMEYGRNDLIWGMFRPFYPAMVSLLYGPGVSWQPWISFLLNALVVFSILLLLAFALGKILAVEWSKIFLGSLIIPFTYDLFQHPSLQEKLVLLFGGLALLCTAFRSRFSTYLFWPLLALLLVFGHLSKASFVIYHAMVIATLGVQNFQQGKWQKNWQGILFIIALGCLALQAHALVASHGTYTSTAYKLEAVLLNIRSSKTILLFLPIGVIGFLTLFSLNVRKNLPTILPSLIGLMGFIGLFLSWGFAGYLISVIATVYASCWIFLAEKTLTHKISHIILSALLIVLPFTTALYRTNNMFSKLQDIGLARLAAADWEKQGIDRIELPCEEGAESFAMYVKSSGQTSLEVKPFRGLQQKAGYLFHDSSMCAIPRSHPVYQNCQTEILWRGKQDHSYRLVRYTCP